MSLPAWAHSSLTFLHDAAACLALAQQERLSLDDKGNLSQASQQALARYVHFRPGAAPDGDELGAAYCVFSFRLLGQAGMLGAAVHSVRLASTALDWLALPPAVQLQQLRHTWFQSLPLGWSGLPAIALENIDSRWTDLTLEALRSIAALPVAEWTDTSAIIADLEQRGRLGSGCVAHNLPRVRQADEQRAQCMLHFLFQVILPGLGLAELDASLSGLRLRPTGEGAAWLRAALARQYTLTHPIPDTAVELITLVDLRFPRLEEASIVVGLSADQAGDDLSVRVRLSAPAQCTFDIVHVAQPVRDASRSLYRVNQHSVRQAVGWGYSISKVIFLLARYSGGQLPPAALAQLSEWQTGLSSIPCEVGYLLRLADPDLAAMLRQKEPFRQRTLPLASGQHVWVSQAQAKALFRYLRRLGYILTPLPLLQGEEGGPGGMVRYTLPLPQLWVALNTYQAVRQRLPGLADLSLDDLAQTIQAALSPNERAAAQRLLESHRALLEQIGGQSISDRSTGEQSIGEQSIGSRPPSSSVTMPALACTCSASTSEAQQRGSPPHRVTLSTLQSAIDTKSSLDLTYADTKGNLTRRRVCPLRLEQKYGQDYLVAYCELRHDCKQSERNFRLDRIISVE